MSETPALMTGGSAIVEALIANGVTRLYGLPGAQMYPLFDALALRADRIRTFSARHEQACGWMAFGEARSTGQPAVFSVVPGPGVLNTAAALATALGTCAPVLCLTGQVPSAFLGKGRGHLHEIPDQLGVLSRLTKWAARIERVEDVAEVMSEAFVRMRSGRPGPVAIEMAWDVMASKAVAGPFAPAVPPPPAEPDAAEIDTAVRLLLAARRPMIMTGSGAQHAGAAVRELAEELDAPVAAFRGGRGIFAENEDLGISSATAHRLWPETDAVIGIGTRLEMPTMRWTGMMKLIDRPEAPPHVIRIDVDPDEMTRLVPHAGIVADAETGTRALTAALRARRAPPAVPDRAAVRTRIAEAKVATRAAIEIVQPQIAYLDVIRRVLPDDGFFVGELCQVGFASYFGFDVRRPYTYVSEGYQGTLGFGFPAALGVKAAHPARKVLSVTGDGGFMFAVQELATAAQENLAVVVLLFDNAAYGNVRRDQKTLFDGRVIGSDLANPDFVALAAAFGVEARSVASPEELEPVLAEALAADVPVLVHVRVPPDTETAPWPFIHPK